MLWKDSIEHDLYKDGGYGFVLRRSNTGECSIIGYDDGDDYISDIPDKMKCKVKYLGLPIKEDVSELRRLHNYGH